MKKEIIENKYRVIWCYAWRVLIGLAIGVMFCMISDKVVDHLPLDNFYKTYPMLPIIKLTISIFSFIVTYLVSYYLVKNKVNIVQSDLRFVIKSLSIVLFLLIAIMSFFYVIDLKSSITFHNQMIESCNERMTDNFYEKALKMVEESYEHHTLSKEGYEYFVEHYEETKEQGKIDALKDVQYYEKMNVTYITTFIIQIAVAFISTLIFIKELRKNFHLIKN